MKIGTLDLKPEQGSKRTRGGIELFRSGVVHTINWESQSHNCCCYRKVSVSGLLLRCGAAQGKLAVAVAVESPESTRVRVTTGTRAMERLLCTHHLTVYLLWTNLLSPVSESRQSEPSRT